MPAFLNMKKIYLREHFSVIILLKKATWCSCTCYIFLIYFYLKVEKSNNMESLYTVLQLMLSDNLKIQ